MIKSKTKTASVRLPKEMFEEIDSICEGVGCSRNDWIKDTLQDKLREESAENSQDQDISKEIEVDKQESHYDRFGNYFHFDKNRNKWICKLNEKNLRITN